MFASVNAAPYVSIQGPTVGKIYNNSGIYLGKVGPGESFYIMASPATVNNTGFAINIGWDTLEAVNLPQGWAAQASPLYENPMKMKVTVAPNAKNGTYELVLRAVNVQNYSRIGNLTFKAYINVTPNVFGLNVTPKIFTTGIGQPVSLLVTINNTGISDDPFVISARGLPAWNVSDTVIALHSKSTSFIYPVYVNEPGVYIFNLSVSSTTSSLIHRQYVIKLIGEASVPNDYSAVGQGVLLAPIVYEPMYAVMLFLEDIYNLASR
jgi:uncharacterized membrane protein